MILTDFLSGAKVKNTDTRSTGAQTASNRADSSLVSRQIKALTPGQTLQGEVVSRNGGQVQIKVADDLILEARVDPNVNLEVGKNVTFEVRNNGQTLTLSPLFANTASQDNALKALEMASLPVNQDTMSMTGLMMKAGLPIDRNSLQQMFREVNSFPESDISDVVDLHKLGLPVNEENLAQISSYKNLNHQLVEGMHTVLDALPETMESMVAGGNAEGAARMFQELLRMIQELPSEENASAAAGTAGAGDTAGTAEEAAAAGEIPPEEANGYPNGNGIPAEGKPSGMIPIQDLPMPGGGSPAVQEKGGAPSNTGTLPQSELTETVKQMAEEIRNILPEILGREDGAKLLAAAGEDPACQNLLRQFAGAVQEGDLAAQAKVLHQLAERGIQESNYPLLEGLLGSRSVQRMLSEGMSRLWTLQPQEVGDSEKVEALYSRLDRQLKSLAQHLEQNGQTQSAAFKAVSNMTQNLDFLQQINQAYTYVQLPLRLQQGDAHGDLYVYTNKRSLAAKDGEITALLHLDMEHLGPVDVYVAMQMERVNTRFYVQDDEILDFIESHMQLLTQRLQKRGYQCSFAMQVKDEKEPEKSGVRGLTATQEHAGQMIAQYAFDVRA
ncbi:MAG: flagellar hook-length control protein FliK [Muribaculum sp.]|nr:flagellar hook-length control protein FliK [Muribaculum sp.]